MKKPKLDMLGTEILEGDVVVFNPPHLKGLYEGTVLELRTKAAFIKYENGTHPTCSRSHNQVVVNLNKRTVKVPEEKVLEVGCTVHIATDSRYFGEGDTSNPMYTDGVVTEWDGTTAAKCLGIYVTWDNGEFNSYSYEDLVVV